MVMSDNHSQINDNHSQISEQKARSTLAIFVGIFAVILLFFGFAKGKGKILNPSLEKYRQVAYDTRVPASDLAQWIVQGRRTFFLVGFRNNADIQFKGMIRTSDHVDKEKINDLGWIRSRFPKVKVPMIVYGENQEESIEFAAKMRYYGYNVRMLDGGFNQFYDQYLMPYTLPVNASAKDLQQAKVREAWQLFFSGHDKNLGQKKTVTTAPVQKGGKKAGAAVEGC